MSSQKTLTNFLHTIQNRSAGPLPKEWSSVCVCLFTEDSMILIKRSLEMRYYAGQIACFGGHREPGENDPEVVARREFSEETGAPLDGLNYLNYINPIEGIWARKIIPVIGKLEMDETSFNEMLVSNGEWDTCFKVKWSHLIDLANWSTGLRSRDGKADIFYYCTLPHSEVEILSHLKAGPKPHLQLWGVTAKIIWTLVQSFRQFSHSN